MSKSSNKPVKIYEYYKDGKPVLRGSREEMAKAFNITVNTFVRWAESGHPVHKFVFVGNAVPAYDFYHEDEFIIRGSYDDIERLYIFTRNQMDHIRRESNKNPNRSTRIIRLEGETVIVKRTHNAKFAPIPENEPIREIRRVKRPTMQVSIDQPVKQTELVINDYHKGLYKSMFKGWS